MEAKFDTRVETGKMKRAKNIEKEMKERSLLQETVFFINFIVILADPAIQTLGPRGGLRHFGGGRRDLDPSFHSQVSVQEGIPNLPVLFLQNYFFQPFLL
jgi:hypothetical protein